MMRARALLVAALMAVGVLAPAAGASAAGLCYDLDLVVNGDTLIDEADCLEA